MVNMETMPLRWGHYRVLAVASLGQITGAGLATLVGIVLPMIQLTRHTELSSFAQGLVACTSLVGITFGSVLFGRLSDRYGYLFFFRFCPLLVTVAALAAFFASGLPWLVAGLFFMGLGIGGGYSLDSDYISEIMPRRWRLLMVGVAKASSSLGNIAVAVVCFYLLKEWEEPQFWNRLLLIIAALGGLMVLLRIRFAQSPGWLMAHGRQAEAEKAVRYFLGNDVEVLLPGGKETSVDGSHPATTATNVGHHIGSDMEVGEIRNRPRSQGTAKVSLTDLLHGMNLKRVIFSGIPWACEGLGVYGIGVFLPVLVMALGLEKASEEPFQRIISSVQVTTYINICILPGFLLGLYLVNRWYHVRTQVWGFVLCAAGLTLLYIGYKFHLPVWLSIAGFMIFEIFLNAGPHLMTFIIPSQIYPVPDRGEGAGLAAAIGKVGAVLGVLSVPLLLGWGGIEVVLLVSIFVQLAGAAVTAVLGREVLPQAK